MPTTDPVRRRKQNCENQKKFRERQNKLLDGLKATLEEQKLRIVELEKETEDLRSQNSNANADIQQLREINTALQLSGTPRLSASLRDSGRALEGQTIIQAPRPSAPGSSASVLGSDTSMGWMSRYGMPSPSPELVHSRSTTCDIENSGIFNHQASGNLATGSGPSFDLVTPATNDAYVYESRQRPEEMPWLYTQNFQPSNTNGDGTTEAYLPIWNLSQQDGADPSLSQRSKYPFPPRSYYLQYASDRSDAQGPSDC